MLYLQTGDPQSWIVNKPVNGGFSWNCYNTRLCRIIRVKSENKQFSIFSISLFMILSIDKLSLLRHFYNVTSFTRMLYFFSLFFVVNQIIMKQFLKLNNILSNILNPCRTSALLNVLYLTCNNLQNVRKIEDP